MTLDLTCPETPISVLLADDDDPISFAVTDQAGAAANIAGATFTFFVLSNQFDADADALITASGIIDDATGGLGHVGVTADDKADLLEIGSFYYRLVMDESNDTMTTIMRGPYRVMG